MRSSHFSHILEMNQLSVVMQPVSFFTSLGHVQRVVMPRRYTGIFSFSPAPGYRRCPRRLAKGRLRPVRQGSADDGASRCTSRLLQATAPADPARPRSPLSTIPSRAPKPAASPAKTTRCRAFPAKTILPATAPFSIDGTFPSSSSASMVFPFPSSQSAVRFGAAGDDSSPGSWDNNLHPSGGFMSYFSSQPHNSHLVGAMNNPLPTNNVYSSPEGVENILESENDTVRTEKRILWNVDEDVRLMSAWIEHSTDSTCGADKGGGQYWGEVVETYNKTTSPLRRRSVKQCKDRWHKINKWTDLFECAYVKARRLFTSGYSAEMWRDVAHKFYVDDNKNNKDVTGPYMLMEVWKICRNVPKGKTYNENLKNARKRKSFHLEGESEENEDTHDEMPKRPVGQKAAKKAALAAKNGKVSSSSDDGHSKDSPIELDKFERYSKFQETNNDKRMKMLDKQEKIASEKLEATRLAQLTAQDYREGKKLEKETKMMETYNSLASQDTSSMSDEEKAQRLSMLKKLQKALFPE